MIESWVGEDTFRRAIHDYLTAHAWGNATASDLFAALEKGSGKPAGAVAAVASSFVDRTGVPDVEVRLACDKARKSWSVELSESTWKPLGAAAPAREASWTIPACVRVAGQKDTSCVELSEASPKKTVEGSGACPAYVAPNAEMKGYYRSSFSAANARALAKAAPSLDTATRVGILSDTWAQVRGGQLSVTTLLEILPLFDHDDDRRVIEEEARILEGMSNAVIDDDSRAAFRAYVRARLSGRAHVLGWTGDHPLPAVGSDRDDAALARASTLLALGELGADDATLKEADRYATAWLAEPAAVDADIAQVAVRLAAHRGKEDRLMALAQVAEHGATPEIRFLAQQHSAQFDDPAVEAHALDRVLTDAVRKQDVMQVLGPAMAYIGSRQAALAWLEAHFDALRGKLAGSLARGTMGAAAWACTPECTRSRRAILHPAREGDRELGPRAGGVARGQLLVRTAARERRRRGDEVLSREEDEVEQGPLAER